MHAMVVTFILTLYCIDCRKHMPVLSWFIIFYFVTVGFHCCMNLYNIVPFFILFILYFVSVFFHVCILFYFISCNIPGSTFHHFYKWFKDKKNCKKKTYKTYKECQSFFFFFSKDALPIDVEISHWYTLICETSIWYSLICETSILSFLNQ